LILMVDTPEETAGFRMDVRERKADRVATGNSPQENSPLSWGKGQRSMQSIDCSGSARGSQPGGPAHVGLSRANRALLRMYPSLNRKNVGSIQGKRYALQITAASEQSQEECPMPLPESEPRNPPERELRTYYRHPCKSLSTEKHESSVRALESALLVRSGAVAAHVCLSAVGSCTRQNRTSICCLRLRRAVAED
jgi:hypothetical protein